MNARAIGELVLRLWGAMLLIGALSALPMEIMMTVSAPVEADPPGIMTRQQFLATLLYVLLQAAIGASLLRWGHVAARVAVPGGLAVELPADEQRLHRLGFALVGAVVLIAGLQDAAAAGYSLAAKPTWDETDPFSYLMDRQRENVVRGVVQILAGLLLLAGRERIARAWSLLRSRPPDEGEEPSP